MTRMGREFSLVLLGSGILTAGYFVAPSHEEELKKKSEEQAAKRVGGTHYRSSGMPLILFLHSPGYNRGGMRPPATPGVSRGGIGGIGRSMGAGGSS